jgi:hypothetical protein
MLGLSLVVRCTLRHRARPDMTLEPLPETRSLSGFSYALIAVMLSFSDGRRLAVSAEGPLAGLSDVFRYREVVTLVGERRPRGLAADGGIVAVARGLYRKADWHGDEDLIVIAAKSKDATVRLRSALARHDLIDDPPAAIDIAIPRGAWRPALQVPVRWHHFDSSTFALGWDALNAGAGRMIGCTRRRAASLMPPGRVTAKGRTRRTRLSNAGSNRVGSLRLCWGWLALSPGRCRFSAPPWKCCCEPGRSRHSGGRRLPRPSEPGPPHRATRGRVARLDSAQRFGGPWGLDPLLSVVELAEYPGLPATTIYDLRLAVARRRAGRSPDRKARQVRPCGRVLLATVTMRLFSQTRR